MCDNCVTIVGAIVYCVIIVGGATAAGATSWAVCSQLALESTLSPHSGWKGAFSLAKTQFYFLISRFFFDKKKHNFISSFQGFSLTKNTILISHFKAFLCQTQLFKIAFSG